MSVKRRRHSPGFKFKVALEAAKEQRTISQLSSELSLHPTQTSDCRAADCGGVRLEEAAFGEGEDRIPVQWKAQVTDYSGIRII